jgi:hypothetical protein
MFKVGEYQTAALFEQELNAMQQNGYTLHSWKAVLGEVYPHNNGGGYSAGTAIVAVYIELQVPEKPRPMGAR